MRKLAKSIVNNKTVSILRAFLLALSVLATVLGLFGNEALAQVCPSNITTVGGQTSCWVPPNSGVTISDLTDSNPVTIASDSTYGLPGGNTLGCGLGSSAQPQSVNSGCDLTSGTQYSPSSLTIVMKFAGTGGPLAQFASTSSVSAPFQYYELYLDTFGRLSFGASNFGALNVLQTGTKDRPKVYADGNPHIVVASLGSNGMRLYVDGSLVANNSQTLANYSTGYWLFGNASLGGANPSGQAWPYAPGQGWFNGTLYYWAWWNSQLTDAQAESISNAGTNPPSPIANNYVTLTGQLASLATQQGLAYANLPVTFRTDATQLPACGATLPVIASTQTYYTDSQGNLPTVQLQQGAHVNMIVGNNTTPLIMPCQSTIGLSTLLPAQTPLPDAVSAVVLAGPLFQGTSVTNPAVGTVGPATLTSPGTQNNTCAGGTVTINRALGPQQNCTMSAATTIAFSNMLDGAPALILDIITDGNSSHIPTFPGGVVWPGGTAPTITTTNGGHTFFGFLNEGGTIYGSITSTTTGSGAFPLTATANFNHYSGINVDQISLAPLTAPTPTCVATCSGTCATTYTYALTAVGDNSAESNVSSTITCTNASSLSSSNFNTISWTNGAGQYGGTNVYGRSSSLGTIGKLINCNGTSGNCTIGSYKDDGTATAGAAVPVINNTGRVIGGTISGWMMGQSGTNPMVSGDFMSISGIGMSATETLEVTMVPGPAVVTNFGCFVNTPPGASKSWTFTLDFGGAGGSPPNPITCQISGASSTTCGPVAQQGAVVFGTLLDVGIAAAGGPTNSAGGCSLIFE